MPKGVSVALAAVVVALVTGCGSSSGGWQLVSQARSSSTNPTLINTAYVGRPSDVEVKVSGTPGVLVRTAYTFVCGDFANGSPSTTVYGPLSPTPQTVSLTVPPGPPTDCRLNVGAFHGKPADLTLSLYARPVSS
jgi:hypothetical protein